MSLPKYMYQFCNLFILSLLNSENSTNIEKAAHILSAFVEYQYVQLLGEESFVQLKFISSPKPLKGFWEIGNQRIPVGYPR